MLGLYLFNDALVVTRRTTRHTPFGRSVQHIYRFETCCSLNRLRIDDIPDSKCKYTSKTIGTLVYKASLRRHKVFLCLLEILLGDIYDSWFQETKSLWLILQTEKRKQQEH